MTDDAALMREFAESGSEDAFRTLVERHSGMVHGVAMRVSGEALADEVTQAVFIIFARKARSLRRETLVAGWLYRTARFVALEAARREKRRRERHEELSTMSDRAESDSLWKQMAPELDDAIGRLGERERSAVVLRFLEGRTFAEVADALGITEAAAKMRVGRAVEKLRANLAREGVMASASALGASLSAHGVGAAPAGLANVLTAAALDPNCGISPLGILIKGGLKAMAMSKAKTAALVVLPLLLLCGGIYGVYEVKRPRPVVGTFEPMAGEWEGKLELSGDDVPSGPPRPAALRVRTSQNGRACEIEMRVGEGQDEQHFRFTHLVDDAGRSITTTDDPQIGMLNGPGEVTLGRANGSGQWQAGFRAKHRAGRSECEWKVDGSELKISRHDVLALGGGKVNRYSLVALHRKQD